MLSGEPIDSDFPLRLRGERSIGKERVSEILVPVNITEKTTLPEFSVRLFVSVLLLGSQIKSSVFNARHRKHAV